MTETEAERGQWWITTDILARGGEKILGPFATQELALSVRRYVELAEAPRTFWVDQDEAAATTPEAPAWHDGWSWASRDGDGNLILRYEPSGGLYKVLPVEEC